MLRRVSPAHVGLRLLEAVPPLLSARERHRNCSAWLPSRSSCNQPMDIGNLKIRHGFVDTSTTYSDVPQDLYCAYPRMSNSFYRGYKVQTAYNIAQSAQKRGVNPMHCRHIHYSMRITKQNALPLCIIALNTRNFNNVLKQSGSYGSFLIFERPHTGQSDDDHEHKSYEDTGKAGERVSRLGLMADIGLTAMKAFAGYASGSTAVIADAGHSMSDVVLSAVALWSFKAARAPKDQMHPYGHGKFETVGALGIASMLLLTGGGIAWHALEVIQGVLSATDGTSVASVMQSGLEQVQSFKHEHLHGVHHYDIDVEHQVLALAATVISICVKEGLYWVTKKVGDASGSELLKANAWHHRSDAISSVIALLGVGGAMLGWQFLDPLAGLLVSGLIVKAGLQTGYHSLQELVDSALPDSVLTSFKETVMMVNGVKGCHALRGRRAGSSIHLDIHIEVDPWLSVTAAHAIGESVRRKLRENHSSLEEVFIHIGSIDAYSPSSSSHDSTVKIKCDEQVAADDSHHQQQLEEVVRELIKSRFNEAMAFERLRCHFLQGRLVVELDISMERIVEMRDAMEYARTLEELTKEAYPKISAVETRLRLTSYPETPQRCFQSDS